MRAISPILLFFFHIALIGLVYCPLVWSESCNSHINLRCDASAVAYVLNRDGTLQQLSSASQSKYVVTPSSSQTAMNKPTPVYNGMDAGGGPVKRTFRTDYVPGSMKIPAQISGAALGKPPAIQKVETQPECDHHSVQGLSERTSFQLCCGAWDEQCVAYNASLSFAFCYNPETYMFQLSNGAYGSLETLEFTYTDGRNGSFQDLSLDFDYFTIEPLVEKQTRTDESMQTTSTKYRDIVTVTVTWVATPSEIGGNTSMEHHFETQGTINGGTQQGSKRGIWKKMMFLALGWTILASTALRGGTAGTRDDDGEGTEGENNDVSTPATGTTSQIGTKANILGTKLRAVIDDLSNKGRQKLRLWCRRHPKGEFQESGFRSGVWSSAADYPEEWSSDSFHHPVCAHQTNPSRLRVLQLKYLTDCPICEELLPHQMFFEEVLPVGLKIEELGEPLIEVKPDVAEYAIIQGYEGYVKVGSDLEMIVKWATEEKIGPRGVGRGW